MGVLTGGYLPRRDAAGLTRFSEAVQQAMAPIQSRLTGWLRAVHEEVSWLARLRRIDAENQRLREEIVRLQLQLTAQQEAERENRLLRQLLHMDPPPEYVAISASIIERVPRQWTRQVLLDRGEKAGVVPNAVVVSPGGAVGRGVSTTEDTARVLLLTDPTSAVGGIVERTGDLVLVEGVAGNSGQLQARTLSPHAEVKPGDMIITSGLGGIFPKGLPLGKVVSVDPDPYGLATHATIMPAADFGRLEYLLILVDSKAYARQREMQSRPSRETAPASPAPSSPASRPDEERPAPAKPATTTSPAVSGVSSSSPSPVSPGLVSSGSSSPSPAPSTASPGQPSSSASSSTTTSTTAGPSSDSSPGPGTLPGPLRTPAESPLPEEANGGEPVEPAPAPLPNG